MASKNKKKAGNKNVPKKSNTPLIFMAIVVLCLAVAAVVIPKQGKTVNNPSDSGGLTEAPSEEDGNAQEAPDDGQDVQVIEEGGSLVIPVSEVSETAKFYPVEVDGTEMEILAVRDSEGNIRTAFNTCQICYGSGRGYYVQQGDVLVCQNCGNRFTVEQVEIESGGCNPWPIFAENKTETEDSITISYDFLSESREIFDNWKVSY